MHKWKHDWKNIKEFKYHNDDGVGININEELIDAFKLLFSNLRNNKEEIEKFHKICVEYIPEIIVDCENPSEVVSRHFEIAMEEYCDFCNNSKIIEPAKYIDSKDDLELKKFIDKAKEDKKFIYHYQSTDGWNDETTFEVVEECPKCKYKFTENDYDNYVK